MKYACNCICMNTHSSLFHALADPARFRIVEAMKSGECAVGDIVERMDIHQSGVSRHLRILAEAGIVQMRPDGQKRLYSLRKEAFDQLEAWVTGYRRHWEARLDRFGAALKRNRAAAKPASREKS
jgi:DNA-binding transcriptional ArsR family regulator